MIVLCNMANGYSKRETAKSFESYTDSNNRIYIGDIEGNGINIFHPNNGSLTVYVQDPRIAWPDTFSVTEDGYIYWVNDQYWRTPTFYPQTDRRQKPFTLMRVKCPDGGKKVLLK